ncbi:MAG: DJ-1/PfpI family protein [Pseudomonadota bacterium]
MKLRIAVLLFDGVNAIDVTGPTEVFASARLASGECPYEIETWTSGDREVRCESGLRLLADRSMNTRRRADLLLIPGGRGIREPRTLTQCASWLKRNQARFNRVVSVCTGAYVLAAAGVVDGMRITTHWAFAKALQNEFPKVDVCADRLFERSGKFWTSGGVTAGIDLALQIVSEDVGRRAAMEVARELVVFLRRSGHQSQFSEPLKTQASAPAHLDNALSWAVGRLGETMTVEQLAARSGLSTRQFSRSFKQAYGTSPATYLKRMRLDRARTLLSQGNTVTQTAHSVGFETEDGLRRAFLSAYGVTPSRYRARFLNSVRG